MAQHNMKILTILFISLLSITSVTAAVDDPGSPVSPPHQFYGYLEVNGQPAPDGTIIEAYLGAAFPEISDNNGFTATRTGVFGAEPYYFIVSGDESDSVTVNFYLFGDDGDYYPLGSYPFEKYETTELDFSIDCSACVETRTITQETPRNTGGGGGGSSVGTTTQAGDESETEGSDAGVCVPDWKCSSWTVCSNGNRERVCIDRNDCGTEEALPVQSEVCEVSEGSDEASDDDVVEQSAAPSGLGDRLTGMVTGASGFGALIFLVAIALIVLFVVRRNN